MVDYVINMVDYVINMVDYVINMVDYVINIVDYVLYYYQDYFCGELEETAGGVIDRIRWFDCRRHRCRTEIPHSVEVKRRRSS